MCAIKFVLAIIYVAAQHIEQHVDLMNEFGT